MNFQDNTDTPLICSLYLEQMSGVSVEKNILKGVGTASNVVGKLVGGIPIINRGSVDEFLQDGGAHLTENAAGNEEKVIREFATVSDPGISLFINQMETMIQIYNHTSSISFDTEKIYLISE